MRKAAFGRPSPGADGQLPGAVANWQSRPIADVAAQTWIFCVADIFVLTDNGKRPLSANSVIRTKRQTCPKQGMTIRSRETAAG